ncbi:hypothetical protein KSP39_PZI007432 [Platanthera zijinensis]|uniref:Uncharacterized protein n=1 Tax=Platanthera zijinensis TaxID=2320716 RepID=A0AAP0BRE4_9ASPA
MRKSLRSAKMVYARTDAAVAFHSMEHKKCKLTEAELDAFIEQHMAGSRVLARLPKEQERLNFSTATQIAIPIDHFDSGFKFPLLWEIADIFDHYAVVPGQLAQNTIAAIYSYVSYLRSEKIAFSLNMFRRIFFVRSITPSRGRQYKGEIYFYCRGIKVVGLPNKIHNWTSRYLIFKGDLGFSHTCPQVRADSAFKSVKLDAVEGAIVVFLAGARLDIEYYLPLLPNLETIASQETLRCRLIRPKHWADWLQHKEREKRKLQRRGNRKGISLRTIPPPKDFDLQGFGKNQKDLRGNPMINWHEKNKHVRLSSTLPSWRSPWISHHAPVAISALYGKRNLRDLKNMVSADIPLLAAQFSVNSAVTNHFPGCLTRDLLEEYEQLRIENELLKNKNRRLGKRVNQYK